MPPCSHGFRMSQPMVKFGEKFITSASGYKLFGCRWVPEKAEPKALVFLLHGYAMECSIAMKATATRLAKAGYAVHGLDCVGHGRSEGLHGYIPCFDKLVDDYSAYYTSVSETEENAKKQRYLFGESMGGTVAPLLHFKKPGYWDGAVLVAPMCKLADNMKQNPLAFKVLTQLTKVVPTWKICPGEDIIEIACPDPEAKKEVRENPYWYKGRPQLKTGKELYKSMIDLEERFSEVKVPFLIVHGGADRVTDPGFSRLLCETASSSDKTFKLYEGMWHALTYGEFPENRDRVLTDIVEWLDQRSNKESSTTIDPSSSSLGVTHESKNRACK